ncbi:hypothetical protein ACFY93_15795 [Streptomyces sp. NPDC008313]|uniref:hypothetical protein n=1 Tax=Streptomyces sp. NPDC008313 TaxID=3364826 RepID=UPI0036E6D7CB
MSGHRNARRGRARRRTRGGLLLVALLGAVTLVACGSDDDGGGSSASPRPTAPDTSSFSGTPPSGLESAASSAVGSARASASAAASSASAAASSFAASVSADTARAAAAAEAELKKVEGRGNAVSDVSMTGLPREKTGGLLAVLVTITNRTDSKASYAVQVDFEDSDGKVVDTRFLGAPGLAPGKRAQPVAVSREPAGSDLTPRLTKAQRY